jgi:hypothetical protein
VATLQNKEVLLMAKVTGPLFSVDARGKIADSIVFMGWRGLKTVRRYVVPANPRTANQLTTRGFFSTAVNLYHTLSSLDKGALRRSASGQPYSGFNLFVGWCKKALDTAVTWTTISGVTLTPGAAGTGQITIAGDATASDEDLKLIYGTTPAMIDGEIAGIAVTLGEWSQVVGSLAANTTYYFKLTLDDAAPKEGETGIYSAVSPAAE